MKTILGTRGKLTGVLAVLLFVGFLTSFAHAQTPGVIGLTSHSSFHNTVIKLQREVSKNGLVILKKFNLQKCSTRKAHIVHRRGNLAQFLAFGRHIYCNGLLRDVIISFDNLFLPTC